MTHDMQPEIEKLEQSLAAARARGDQRAEAENLYGLDNAHRSARNFLLTTQYYDEALAIALQLSDTQLLFRMGINFLGFQERPKALNCFEEVFTISASEVHQSLFMMAETFDRMGNRTQAAQYHEKALAIAAVFGDYEHQIMCLGRLARYDIDDSKPHEALQKHNQARALAQEHGDKAKEADSLADIANIHKSLGNQQEALTNFDQALELIRQTNNRTEEILTINHKGDVFRKFGELAQAEAQYELGLSIARQYHDRTGECDSLYNLGMLQKKIGNLASAINYFEEGHRLIIEGNNIDDWKHRVKTPIAFFLYRALVETYEATGNYTATLHLLEQDLAESCHSSPLHIQELEAHIAQLRQKITEQSND